MLQPGQPVISFSLPSMDGSVWNSDTMAGNPCLLAFFRFASCPFCNLRLHQLISRLNELPKDFAIVAVFESSLPDLQKYTERHDSPFSVLADAGGVVHGYYGIRHSWKGVLKGLVLRFPTLLKAMFGNGYFPFTIGGRMDTMPADFLVNGAGIIEKSYYGKDEGDHLDFDQIKEFAFKHSGMVAEQPHGTLVSG